MWNRYCSRIPRSCMEGQSASFGMDQSGHPKDVLIIPSRPSGCATAYHALQNSQPLKYYTNVIQADTSDKAQCRWVHGGTIDKLNTILYEDSARDFYRVAKETSSMKDRLFWALSHGARKLLKVCTCVITTIATDWNGLICRLCFYDMLRYDAAIAYSTKIKYQNNIYRSNLSDRYIYIQKNICKYFDTLCGSLFQCKWHTVLVC